MTLRVFLVVFDQGDEDSEFENSSQASFETINGEAARRQNLPKFSTEISPAARPLLRKEVRCSHPLPEFDADGRSVSLEGLLGKGRMPLTQMVSPTTLYRGQLCGPLVPLKNQKPEAG